MTKESKHFYEFGPFRVDPDQRLLLRDNRPVPLQPKAFETLLVLVQNSETVVLKDDLMKSVWPDTFVEESNLTQNIFVLRKTLGEVAGERRYIVTVPGRGYRLTEKVRFVPHQEPEQDNIVLQQESIVLQSHSTTRVVIDEVSSRGKAWYLVAGVAIAAILGGTWYWRSHPAPKLREKDRIVIADFTNTTGDVVFDDTLKQALAIQLEQSPFLRVLSDNKVQSTLKLMNHATTEHITQDIAREICLRNDGKAILQGSIGSVGNHYLVGLRAVECQSSETLGSAAAEATNRDGILAALGSVANGLRAKLGESLASVEKFNKPLEQATTSSLDALKVYTLGQITAGKADDNAAVAYYSRAIQLDPNFARCYAALGSAYNNLEQPSRSIENYKKAYALRDRVSDRERYYIEATYYSHVTGEVDKAIQTYREWIHNYPQDLTPHFNLGVRYGALGQYDKALPENLEALKLAPDDAGGYATLMGLYLSLNRWDDAQATYEQAIGRQLDSFVLRENRYALAFLQNDTVAMKQQLAGALGKPREEDLLLAAQSDTEAYFGRFTSARRFSERAMQTAIRNDAKETAALWQAKAALREAEVGNLSRSRKEAQAAIALGPGLSVECAAGLALARAGDFTDAQKIVDHLDTDYPQGTMVQNFHLANIRAVLQLDRNDPSRAVQTLEAAEPYELGGNRTLYPAYLRGLAFLAAKRSEEAAAEFQKLLDHRGLVNNSILSALAHVQLARAKAISGDKEAARKSYQDFFTLWKDADPDLPILKEAQSEYAKLR
jgi:DNA-binding winged helix-turn-helix (wHTH) protein/tetratricopeptide (TPR) repeat protein